MAKQNNMVPVRDLKPGMAFVNGGMVYTVIGLDVPLFDPRRVTYAVRDANGIQHSMTFLRISTVRLA